MAKLIFSNRIVITVGGTWAGGRQMKTFVNGKACANIDKGVFQTPDNRFAASADSITLFASTTEAFMPGLRVKYIEFRPNTMSIQVSFPHLCALFPHLPSL